MMKKNITFDKFDILLDRMETISSKCGNWWPTIKEIQDYIEPRLEQNFEFLAWVASTADPPKTEEQKESKRYINNLIFNTINANEKKLQKDRERNKEKELNDEEEVDS